MQFFLQSHKMIEHTYRYIFSIDTTQNDKIRVDTQTNGQRSQPNNEANCLTNFDLCHEFSLVNSYLGLISSLPRYRKYHIFPR